MYALCNGTPHNQNQKTQFRYKIFRHIHLFSELHVHEHSMHVCEIIYDVTLPFFSKNQDNIMDIIIKE